MFTGIIEEVGIFGRLIRSSASCTLEISASKVLEGTNIGDSIAVNGVCLTVVSMTSTSFKADVMPETLSRTDLGRLTTGSLVNLERALEVGSRLGGHIVTGHIDGTGVIGKIEQESNANVYTIRSSSDVVRFMVEKGSVALDGVSLTIVDVTSDIEANPSFRVSLIPHTNFATNMSKKRVGDMVNIECDVIGKYVLSSMERTFSSEDDMLTMDKMRSLGF